MRALLIGVALLALALPVTGVPVREPLVLILAVALALMLFSSLGVIVGDLRAVVGPRRASSRTS